MRTNLDSDRFLTRYEVDQAQESRKRKLLLASCLGLVVLAGLAYITSELPTLIQTYNCWPALGVGLIALGSYSLYRSSRGLG